MNKKVLKLYISKAETNKLEVNIRGVVGDKYYDKDINRSVLIASIESYKLSLSNNIDITHGALGENILVNFNPYSLSLGTKIEIGEVLLEISQYCTLCKSLSKVNSHLPKILKKDRGIFAKVIQSGYIKVNDTVSINSI